MATSISPILDSTGVPFARRAGAAPRDVAVRAAQAAADGRRERRQIRATFDAARDSAEFKNHWANADTFDADSAHNRAVRSRLVTRSRYEVGNNGYMDGMVQTNANFVVGRGPTLHMETTNAEFNTAVENTFKAWQKAIQFRRKFWCMSHAKTQDGEGLAIAANNPKVKHRVKLDMVPIETEQCQTPFLPYGTPGYIDGLKYDEFGNPEHYDVLPYHPGGLFQTYHYLPPVQIPAAYMLHWFQLRRPGQHRGVPEFRSTLNTGAASRRFREATVAAAETAADMNVILRTQNNPSIEPDDDVRPLSTVPIEKRMMTVAPFGWAPEQMAAEHPTATYDSFTRSQLSETARPKNMGYGIAAADSSDYNYSSGKLDREPFYLSVDIVRLDGEDLVLDKLFELWWFEAVIEYGWSTDPYAPPSHSWDWPAHPIADVKNEADTEDVKLKNGTTSLSCVYAEAGLDFEDALKQQATDFGVDVEQMRKILLVTHFPAAAALLAPPAPPPPKVPAADPQQAGEQQPDPKQEPAANG